MKLLLIILTVLQSLLATLEQKTLVSDFTMTYTQSPIANSQPMTYTGNLAMHGKQFSLSMFNMEAAYDGNTLYMYSEELEELSLSTPTEEELVQTNPFLYAQALLPVCQYAEKVIGDKTQITLTPTSPIADSPSPITKFVLRVTTATLLPTTVEIHETEGQLTTLRLNNARYTTETPSFVIEKEGALINDLR
jgi:outer membrane lipoprotein-sorting protein